MERFDGIIHDDSELPAPKDTSKSNGNSTSVNSSSSDKRIACQEEAKKRADGATKLPDFKHPSGFNCTLCAIEEGGWDCLAG